MSKLPSDPVIDEIREVRHQISARFDHDPRRLVEHYVELQKQYEDRLIKPLRPGSVKAPEPVARPAG
jgi:hypothetical protein